MYSAVLGELQTPWCHPIVWYQNFLAVCVASFAVVICHFSSRGGIFYLMKLCIDYTFWLVFLTNGLILLIDYRWKVQLGAYSWKNLDFQLKAEFRFSNLFFYLIKHSYACINVCVYIFVCGMYLFKTINKKFPASHFHTF